MTGTNAVTVKKAIQAMLVAAPALAGVQVSYGWLTVEPQRERVYLGKTSWTATAFHFRNGGAVPRKEDLLVSVHVDVDVVGGDVAGAESRATAIGTAIETAIGADPSLGSTPGVLLALVEAGDLISGADDEQAVAMLTYQVRIQSADT